VSLVGVSLGGVFARDLARSHADLVRQVITLGSPFRLPVRYSGPELSQSIEVWGSHCGLGHNPLALSVIADRLAQPEGTWRPFRRHAA
jgi:pimeloyl-ACP methyl ester carboxylesterase